MAEPDLETEIASVRPIKSGRQQKTGVSDRRRHSPAWLSRMAAGRRPDQEAQRRRCGSFSRHPAAAWRTDRRGPATSYRSQRVRASRPSMRGRWPGHAMPWVREGAVFPHHLWEFVRTPTPLPSSSNRLNSQRTIRETSCCGDFVNRGATGPTVTAATILLALIGNSSNDDQPIT